jgi:anaerobic magnesium-protoporphyrin IX monomethyl ester cyclase
MTLSNVILIGFQEQGNLGVGYVASMLTRRGFNVRILDFRERRESILGTIRSAKPLLVGFSLIFQYYVPQFRALAAYLRDNGIACHFCAGGHYPSLRHEHVLQDVPELDSVVRFEGEITLAELMQRLAEGRNWHDVTGIAYRDGDRCITNQPRQLIADLDELPFPARPLESALTVLGRKASPILASRGCCRDCSFCSIRQFYGQVPGKKVRTRNPAKVVQEMKALYEENGVSIFLFQDDDFPVWGPFGRRWIAQFIDSLREQGLYGKVIWKISCRSDEVEPELFARLRDAGLYVVYLGIESGNETGLRALNKQLRLDDSLRAVRILTDLGLCFTYGFMLFDPSSTFDSLRENTAYLRQIAADGIVPAVFCRMLPYAATPIEDQLAREGRLRGSVHNPDYDFLDSRLNSYFEALNNLVAHWMNGSDALANQLNFAWHEYWMLRRLFRPVPGLQEYEHFLRSITQRCNDYLLNLVGEVSRVFEEGRGRTPSSAEVQADSKGFSEQLLNTRNAFVSRNQQTILADLEAAAGAGCGMGHKEAGVIPRNAIALEEEVVCRT